MTTTPPKPDKSGFLTPIEAAEIAKVVTRILRMRGRKAPPIAMQHLSALFVIEWPYDFDRQYPGRREQIFRPDIIRQLGFLVGDDASVQLTQRDENA